MRQNRIDLLFFIVVMIVCVALLVCFAADTKGENNMKKGFSEIICIIDRSGSMWAIRDDAIGGFNSFIKDQKKHPGEATVTFIQFDYEYEIIYENKPIQDVPVLDASTYVPRGATALLDAVGRTINGVGARLDKTLEELKPESVIVVILTDGKENASKEMNRDKVKEMIDHQQKNYNWQFIYLGANQDAFTEAGAIGIPAVNTNNFMPTGQGVRSAFRYSSDVTTSYRSK